MCRNIKTLFNFEPPATDEEIRSASLQFVRKLSGFNKPSKANEEAFDHAIEEDRPRPDRLPRHRRRATRPRDRSTTRQTTGGRAVRDVGNAFDEAQGLFRSRDLRRQRR